MTEANQGSFISEMVDPPEGRAFIWTCVIATIIAIALIFGPLVW